MWRTVFPRNEGTIDRALRFVVGVALLSLTVVGPATPLGYVGLIPLVTAIVGSCPLYALLGVSTCRPSTRQG